NALGWFAEGFTEVINQVPSTIAVANIAVAATVTTGVPMTLVAASGAGITVIGAGGFLTLPSLNTIAAGALAIDQLPSWVKVGGKFQTWFHDPSKALMRAVSITGSVSATGGNFTVNGADLYGYPQTSRVVHPGGAVTANSPKTFKFVTSVVPQFTDGT